jgi:hypothetical protein
MRNNLERYSAVLQELWKLVTFHVLLLHSLLGLMIILQCLYRFDDSKA